MQNEPKPNLDFQRYFCSPEMFKRSIRSIARQMIVHGFSCDFSSFCPLPLWLEKNTDKHILH
jgi:hypothetical protein